LIFGEGWERGLRLVNSLLALGATPGDRVAVLDDKLHRVLRFLSRHGDRLLNAA
jgi:hypothetical protein